MNQSLEAIMPFTRIKCDFGQTAPFDRNVSKEAADSVGFLRSEEMETLSEEIIYKLIFWINFLNPSTTYHSHYSYLADEGRESATHEFYGYLTEQAAMFNSPLHFARDIEALSEGDDVEIVPKKPPKLSEATVHRKKP